MEQSEGSERNEKSVKTAWLQYAAEAVEDIIVVYMHTFVPKSTSYSRFRWNRLLFRKLKSTPIFAQKNLAFTRDPSQMSVFPS